MTKPKAPTEQNTGELKRVCRLYMRRKTPPSVKDMQALAALAGSVDWIDVVEW
jgi:hypothetical protein